MLLYIPMRSFHFQGELAPFLQHIDIFAQCSFTGLAVADCVRNAMERRDCYASVHRMHICTACIETPAIQWMIRTRMSLAYHDSEEVRTYLMSTKDGHAVFSREVPARSRSPQRQRGKFQNPAFGGRPRLSQPGLR